MQEIVWTCVEGVGKRRIWNEPDEGMSARELSRSLEGDLARDSHDVSTLWMQARNVCRRLNKTIGA